MGFSTNLQGKVAHEALLSRQDAELRLLEAMKRCVNVKVKCDRDYATALSTVASQGLKIDRGDELAGKFHIFVFIFFYILYYFISKKQFVLVRSN